MSREHPKNKPAQQYEEPDRRGEGKEEREGDRKPHVQAALCMNDPVAQVVALREERRKVRTTNLGFDGYLSDASHLEVRVVETEQGVLLRVLLLRRSWSAISLDPRRASHPILLAFLLRLLLPLFRTSQPGTTGHLVTGQYGLVLGADNSRVRRGEAKAPSCLWFLQF